MSVNYHKGNKNKKFFGLWGPQRKISRLYKSNDIKLFIKLSQSGKLHEVLDAFTTPIDDNEFYLGYSLNNESGNFIKYCQIGKFVPLYQPSRNPEVRKPKLR